MLIACAFEPGVDEAPLGLYVERQMLASLPHERGVLSKLRTLRLAAKLAGHRAGERRKCVQSIDQKDWVTPELTVYGDAATLTLVKNKHAGVSDGYTFNGTPISG